MGLITGRLWDIELQISDLAAFGFMIWTCFWSDN